jgi:hypothetical protein
MRKAGFYITVVSALLSLAGRAGAEASRPLLLPARDGTRLELASGERISLPVPRGAELATAQALDEGNEGWIAAGVRPDTAGRSEIFLLIGDESAVTELPPPSGRDSMLRQQPLPLIESGHLAGLLWLEGDNRTSFGVRFAEWNGAGWSAPRTVAAPGPGSQLALTAARLADGTWLAAWSAFDGTDDEIVWSRRGRDGAWSPARRAATGNQVPDVTPALTATRDGALLAWSRFDGSEYRVVVSRFRSDSWSKPEPAAPAGSLVPSFEPAPAGRIWLLYRNAVPRGWTVAELDRAGRPVRRATVEAATDISERPAVRAAGNGLEVAWPGRGEKLSTHWERVP